MWRDWDARSHLRQLLQSLDYFEHSRTNVNTVLTLLSRGAARPWPERVLVCVKRTFQRTVATHIASLNRMPSHACALNFAVGSFQGRRGMLLYAFSEDCSVWGPRVSAAFLSALFNRWPTARRFQNGSSVAKTCALGCGGGAEDSLEHYGCCAAVRGVAKRFLRLADADCYSLNEFLMAEPARLQNEELVCRGVLVYATFMASNYYRSRNKPSRMAAMDALEQHCKNAVRGHASSARILDSLWEVCHQKTSKRLRSHNDNQLDSGARLEGTQSGTISMSRFVSGGNLVTDVSWLGDAT